MEFSAFNKLMVNHFNKMCQGARALFVVDCSNEVLWNLYLDSFPAGTNEIYRKRREFDCSCCHHFFRRAANIVTLKDGIVTSIWDFEVDDPVYAPVVKALREEVHSHPVRSVFFHNRFHGTRIGTDHNIDYVGNVIEKWHHFFIDVPTWALANGGDAVNRIVGEANTSKNVLERSLEELTMDSIDVVLELIDQKTLYRGEEWKGVLTEFKKLKTKYDSMISAIERTNFCWESAAANSGALTRIRNHSIGTLLVDISEGMDLDQAVRRYEAVVAPTNYKRPKAIYTKKMLDDAKKKLESMGYMDSLARRHARMDDITANNVLFCNRDAAKVIAKTDLFDSMEKDLAVNPKKFNRATEIGIDDFISGVLPTAREVEVLLENRHESNLVSLIAPQNLNAKSMFKWDNAFSWAYKGNITDSDIKQNVKNAGGKVDAPLRFSIQWNDEDENLNDFDAHAVCSREHISFCNTRGYVTNGELDVDIICPRRGVPAVENIVYPYADKIYNKTFSFYVHCYSDRGGKSGFKAEIEAFGQLYQYRYTGPVRTNGSVNVADVTIDSLGNVSIVNHLEASSSVSSHKVWNVSTSQFVPVSMIMYSPNYWDEQTGIGHRHVFFMLKDCISDERPNGMYNEFLKNELMEHKRVFEALGAKMAVEPIPDQLSGVGFSVSKRNNMIVKVKGHTERILNIKF